MKRMAVGPKGRSPVGGYIRERLQDRRNRRRMQAGDCFGSLFRRSMVIFEFDQGDTRTPAGQLQRRSGYPDEELGRGFRGTGGA